LRWRQSDSGARLEVIKRCGHLPPIECHEALAEAVSRFLAQSVARPRLRAL